jgi:hypothetical protein
MQMQICQITFKSEHDELRRASCVSPISRTSEILLFYGMRAAGRGTLELEPRSANILERRRRFPSRVADKSGATVLAARASPSPPARSRWGSAKPSGHIRPLREGPARHSSQAACLCRSRLNSSDGGHQASLRVEPFRAEWTMRRRSVPAVAHCPICIVGEKRSRLLKCMWHDAHFDLMPKRR